MITGLILAGGQGRRMGSVDKGLQMLRGRPMVEWVIDRLKPQVDEVLINANQNLEAYAQFGHRVVPDDIGGFAGPLAGLHAGLHAAGNELVVTCPCDSPFLAADLVARLHEALRAHDADLAVARTGEQLHPVFSLVQRKVFAHLGQFLESGGRKIDAWYATLKTVEVDFDDQALAFSNINTREELQAWDNLPPG
jgi:molybdopterin-guanine dinucleotide biosynthesis protein A